MNRNVIGALWDRTTRNEMNDNFEYLFQGVNDFANFISDKVISEIEDKSVLNRKESVATKDDLPAGEEGDTRIVDDTGDVYRHTDGDWVRIQSIDVNAMNDILDEATKELKDDMDNKFQKMQDNFNELVDSKNFIVVSDQEPDDADIWFEVK